MCTSDIEVFGLSGFHGGTLQRQMTLLLGPPGAGKTTLLKALAGKLSASGLNVSSISAARL